MPSRSVPFATNKRDKKMDFTPLIIVASSVVATSAMVLVFAAGWMAARRNGPGTCTEPVCREAPIEVHTGGASRITLANVRERLRRLDRCRDRPLKQSRFLHSCDKVFFTSPAELRLAAVGHLW